MNTIAIELPAAARPRGRHSAPRAAVPAAVRQGESAARSRRTRIELLARYPWPGNVRELENVIERAVLLSQGPQIRARRSPAAAAGRRAGAPTAPAPAISLAELERRHIESVLHKTNWHQGRAASALGISSKTLYRKIREYGFRRPGGVSSAMRILVIEDDPTVGQYVKRGFEEQRWAVDLVADGEEGERRASSEAYDLVVLDMRLPGKCGLEVLHVAPRARASSVRCWCSRRRTRSTPR